MRADRRPAPYDPAKASPARGTPLRYSDWSRDPNTRLRGAMNARTVDRPVARPFPYELVDLADRKEDSIWCRFGARSVPRGAPRRSVSGPGPLLRRRRPTTAQRLRPDRSNSLPLITTRTLDFTTDEGTWISLDLSPDGETIVFELLGDLYALPVSGVRGNANHRGDRAMTCSPGTRPTAASSSS